ncbi:MAG: hypothetical protein EBV97_14260 [Rhodobacteraceae bacterium]|nr:hypothetical protein [Paracoccaceae bacterium]
MGIIAKQSIYNVVSIGLAFLIGVSATILLIVLGSVGVTGSIFIGLLITVVLGTFLNWALFHPLPPIENGRLLAD